MIRKIFFTFFLFLISTAVHAQTVSKNLVYKGEDYNIDSRYLYTNSLNGRFILLGCGNFRMTKNSSASLCAVKTNNLKVYDTYTKKLSTIDLSTTFKDTIKFFAYTFDQDSNLYMAELSETESESLMGDFDIFKFATTEVIQKVVKINLESLKIEVTMDTEEGKFCTQLGYISGKVMCSMNTVRVDSKFNFDLVYAAGGRAPRLEPWVNEPADRHLQTYGIIMEWNL